MATIVKNNYQEKYVKEIVPKMMAEFNFKNPYEVPKIEKVVLNIGIGKIMTNQKNNPESLRRIEELMFLISGQKPSVRPAKESIAGFKVREGMPVGLKITLRGKKKDDFIFRFINLVLPRIRDFWGIPLKNIDEKGVLNYGIREINTFPEISKEQLPYNIGVEISFVPSIRKKDVAIRLYQLMGFPLEKTEKGNSEKSSKK
jgi:large subunit ribosomal protein L5